MVSIVRMSGQENNSLLLSAGPYLCHRSVFGEPSWDKLNKDTSHFTSSLFNSFVSLLKVTKQ